MQRVSLTPGTLDTLLKILHERVLPETYKEIIDTHNKSRADLFKDQMGNGISAVNSAISAMNNEKGYSDTLPPYPDRNYANQSGWQSLIHNELLKFNSKGSAFITSISECLIKTLGLINVHQDAFERRFAYFRGQVDSDWEIQSSIGRKIPRCEIPIDRKTVSRFELDALKKWQNKVVNDVSLKQEVFSGSNPIALDNPDWWALKQHYDDDPITGGTRLIDWTTSPLSGLYFACVDWDGSVDECKDGGLYVTMSGVGNQFASGDYISRLPLGKRDFFEKSGSKINDYFDLSGDVEYPRTIISESESTRQIAQDGHFIFSPSFERPISNWAGPKPFFFAIHRKSKKDILRELYSIGYTPRKIIRGKKGAEALKRLKSELGIYN